MEKENKVLTYATAQGFNLMADGYRAMSLAKTYDAKAAAEALKLTIKEVM